MKYTIKTIDDFSELDLCPLFYVDQYNWGGDYRPHTYGSLAYWPSRGFCVRMTCEEQNPQRLYTRPNDPVYLDSAMEAFFQFYPKDRPSCYLSFEVNANGALNATYGEDRSHRIPFPPELHCKCLCRSSVFPDYWTMELMIPAEVICFVYGRSDFHSGDHITCNFYKIKESEGQTHFGSYTVIQHKEPNFHLTQYFADGILE